MSRKTITLEVENEGQEALLRSYHAFMLEMSDLAQSAPVGQVLDRLEEVAVEKGRERLRATLEQTVQERINANEKKGRRCGSVRVDRSGKIAAPPHEPS